MRSRKAVKTAFWNLAVLGKVSRSGDFSLVWAYSVGTAGAPKRADQEFRRKKSSKSAINQHKVCILHTWCTLCKQLKIAYAHLMHTTITLSADFNTAHSEQT